MMVNKISPTKSVARKIIEFINELGVLDLRDIQPELVVIASDKDGSRCMYKIMACSTDCYGNGEYLYMIKFGELQNDRITLEVRHAREPVHKRQELSEDFFLPPSDLDKKQAKSLKQIARHYMNQRNLNGEIILR